MTEPSIGTLQAGREGEEQVRDDGGEERVERDPDREQHVAVGRAEGLREPREADRRAPVRLAGRRHHANSPVPTNDQPTSRSTTATSPRSSSWLESSTKPRQVSPKTKPASASAISARLRPGGAAEAGDALPIPGLSRRAGRAGVGGPERSGSGADHHRCHPPRRMVVTEADLPAHSQLTPPHALTATGANPCRRRPERQILFQSSPDP
jgi:hypothetical protein